MKLSYILIPSLFLVTSLYAQACVAPTQAEVRRDLLTKIESAVTNHDYKKIELWSTNRSISTSLTQQDLKPLLDKCASRVKWTNYIKNNAMLIPAKTLQGGFDILYYLYRSTPPIPDFNNKLLYGYKNLPKNSLKRFTAKTCGYGASAMLTLVSIPIEVGIMALIVLPVGFTWVVGAELEKLVKDKDFLTYIALKNLYNSLPTGISRHHEIHKHIHRKR